MTTSVHNIVDPEREGNNDYREDASFAARLLAGFALAANILLFITSLPLVMLSAFMFDAPGAASDVRTWLIVGGIWIAPIVFGCGVEETWRATTRRKRMSIRRAVALPTGMVAYVGLSALLMNW